MTKHVYARPPGGWGRLRRVPVQDTAGEAPDNGALRRREGVMETVMKEGRSVMSRTGRQLDIALNELRAISRSEVEEGDAPLWLLSRATILFAEGMTATDAIAAALSELPEAVRPTNGTVAEVQGRVHAHGTWVREAAGRLELAKRIYGAANMGEPPVEHAAPVVKLVEGEEAEARSWTQLVLADDFAGAEQLAKAEMERLEAEGQAAVIRAQGELDAAKAEVMRLETVLKAVKADGGVDKAELERWRRRIAKLELLRD